MAALQTVRQDIPVDYRNGESSYKAAFGPLYREFADAFESWRRFWDEVGVVKGFSASDTR